MKIYPILCTLILTIGCAQQRSPDGGKKDELPSKVIGCKPDNKSINFNQDKITIKFDEYIQIKDPAQIIVSPFLKDKPQIETNGKNIEITFLKSKPNPKTTYTINFGNSIVDVNEGNVFGTYSYVFSTGTYLDSNKISGSIVNAFNTKVEKDIIVGLFKKSYFKDTAFSKSYPSYFTKSNDKGEFSIQNLPQDSFYLFAFNDASANNKYDKDEDLAFDTNVYVTNSNYSAINLKLFKPDPFQKGKLLDTIARNKSTYQFVFYQPKSIKIKEIHQKIMYQKWDPGKNGIDTLSVFLKPSNDTINPSFTIQSNDSFYTYNHPKKSKVKIPPFQINASPPNKPIDSIKLLSNLPIENLPKEAIVIKEDTLEINKTITSYSNFEWAISHQINPNKNYSISIKDSIITNIYNQFNKSINITFQPKTEKDFGNIILNISYSGKEPIIIQLIDDNTEERVHYSIVDVKTGEYKINYIEPGSYKLKVIKDTNKNAQWDNANLQKAEQAEETYYAEQAIIVKAYWDIEQSIDLDKVLKP